MCNQVQLRFVQAMRAWLTIAPVSALPPAPTATAAKPALAPMAAGSAVLPRAVSPKYASESADKGRIHTCLDQYNANKVAGGGAGNGGMTWFEQGGGYYYL